MAVQVAQARPKKDLLDVILGGLQAASAFTSIQKARAEMDAIPETKARIARAEEQQFARQFAEVPRETPGAIELAVPGEQRRGLFVPRAEVAARAQAELGAKQKKAEAETGLRKEWLSNPQTKVSQDVSVAVGKVRAVGQDKPSAAGDLSLIFNYMKLLDPGSVVREGEFATAQNAAGVPDRIQNFYNNILRGERLNPAQRSDFVGRAEQLYEVHWERQKAFNDEFKKIAKDQGLDTGKVVLDLKFEPIKRKGLVPKQKPISFSEDAQTLLKNLGDILGDEEVAEPEEDEGQANLEEFRSLMGK